MTDSKFVEDDDRPGTVAAKASSIRLGLVCDFWEEQWLSMDLYSAMLAREFARHSTEVHAVQLRPRFRQRFSSLPGCKVNSFFWNADRLVNRFHDYQIWLRKQIHKFDVFDLIDHSYAHLIT